MAESAGQDVVSESESSRKSFSMRTTLYGIKKRFPSVENISCQELEQWKKTNKELICLDTRSADEYQVSHLPGSVRVDPEEEPDMNQLGISPYSTVVCYCSVGYRSCIVAQKLLKAHEHGMEKTKGTSLRVYNLEGGVFQWACEGRGLINTQGETVIQVHPYSTLWGLLLPQNLKYKMGETPQCVL